MKKSIYLLGLINTLLFACQPAESPLSDNRTAATSASSARLTASSAFAGPLKYGIVQDKDLKEISGLAESRTNPGYIWVEQDSGSPDKIYLIDSRGKTVATISLPDSNRDWEDIAVGPGPRPNTWYVYLADTGNNDLNHDKIYVYRFEEPSIAGRSLPYKKTLSNNDVQRLDFKYADQNHNCETLMIDPITKDLIFITKEDYDKNRVKNLIKGGVYRAAFPQQEKTVNTLYRTGDLNILTATGGDISADGQEVLIKNYETVYYWKKSSASQSLSQLLTTAPATLTYNQDRDPGAGSKDISGEAIGWRVNGSGYYTIAEVKNNIASAIYYYARR